MKTINKKVIMGALVGILFIGGIGIGIMKHNTAVKPVSISQDASYNKLLSGVSYSIQKKDIAQNGKKIEAKFNIVSKDITANQAKELAKKIYQNTISKQTGLTSVQVNIFNKGGATSKFVSDFYADGLKYQATYNKDFNSVKFLTYNDLANVKGNANKLEWSINNISQTNGNIKVDMVLPQNTKEVDVMAQTKGLLDQVKNLNPSKKIGEEEASITGSSTNGWAYNTKYNDILADVEKSTIN